MGQSVMVSDDRDPNKQSGVKGLPSQSQGEMRNLWGMDTPVLGQLSSSQRTDFIFRTLCSQARGPAATVCTGLSRSWGPLTVLVRWWGEALRHGPGAPCLATERTEQGTDDRRPLRAGRTPVSSSGHVG